MIKINLLPPKKNLFGPLQQEITLLIFVMILVSVLAGLVSAYERNKIGEIKKSIVVLEKELATLSEVAKNVEKLEKDKALLLQRMNVIKKIVVDRNIWPRFFDDLTQKLPNGVWFTNLTQNDSRTITINGFSFTNLLLAKFMQVLETSSFVQKVDLDYAQKVVQSEEDTVKFQIIIILKQEM
ncbi:MAG: PilN domain-containing protein [bacterium]|nr:PilN domain-containing protein [bacterium]